MKNTAPFTTSPAAECSSAALWLDLAMGCLELQGFEKARCFATSALDRARAIPDPPAVLQGLINETADLYDRLETDYLSGIDGEGSF